MQDLTNHGRPAPANVSLDELVSGGYISSDSVQAFEGMETRIWLTVNPSVPMSVLVSARLSDGAVIATLADGSVQQFSAERFAAHLSMTGQSDDSANGSQPSR